MCTYGVQQNKYNTQRLTPKMPSLTCIHTIYNSANRITNIYFQNAKPYMYTYDLNQHKRKQKGLLKNLQSYMCT